MYCYPCYWRSMANLPGSLAFALSPSRTMLSRVLVSLTPLFLLYSVLIIYSCSPQQFRSSLTTFLNSEDSSPLSARTSAHSSNNGTITGSIEAQVLNVQLAARVLGACRIRQIDECIRLDRSHKTRSTRVFSCSVQLHRHVPPPFLVYIVYHINSGVNYYLLAMVQSVEILST